MAHTSTNAYDVTPEEALRQIKEERTRRSWIAAGLFALATLATFSIVYLSYSDVPEAAQPASTAGQAR